MSRSLLWSRNNLLVCVILHFVTFALSQDLAFTGPSIQSSTSYTEGELVTVSWTTPFNETNLLVYQLKETAYAYEILALRFQQSVTYYVWNAGAVDGEPLNSDHPFHFVLENSDSYACQGCVAQSDEFDVRPANSAAGTSTSSLSTSTSASTAEASTRSRQTTANGQPTQTPQTSQPSAVAASTSQSGANGQPTQASQTNEPSSAPSAAGAAGQDQVTSSTSKSDSDDDLKIGLGVGLGLGIPLVLAVIGVFFCLARRRRKQRKRFSYRPTGSGNWTTEEETPPRESDTLGPWAANAAKSRNSGLSQMSHSSWIEPFPFEKPEARDRDAISELRRSIHSSGSEYSQDGIGDGSGKKSSTESPAKTTRSTRETPWPPQSNNGNEANTKYAWMGGSTAPTSASNGWGAGAAAARRSDVSWANTDMSSLEGIPEQLQPVHHRYGSPTGGYYPAPSRGDGRDWPLP